MKSSIQPRKQRKRRFASPMHLRRKLASAHLSKELKAKLSTRKRSAQLHKGDRVKVMRGDRKGVSGKVMEVDVVNCKVYVEGITNRTAKGIEKLAPLEPSNLLIIDGEFSKDRAGMLARSGKQAKKQPQGS